MEALQQRGLQIVLAIGLVLALAPTPAPMGLAAHMRSAAGWLEAGQAAQALAEVELALALQPDLQVGHLLAANALVQLGEPRRAQLHLDRWTGDPDSSRCLAIAVSLALDEISVAVEHLLDAGRQCVELVPEVEAAVDGVAEGGSVEEALALFERMGHREPAWAQFRLGQWLAVSQPDRALAHLALGAELDPQSEQYLNQLAEVIEQARSEANAAFTLAQVGQFMARSGEWRLAAEAFRNAVALDPGYTEARAYLGLAMDRSGGDGLEPLEQAIREAPTAGLPYQLLGMHWRDRGDPAAALAAFEQAAKFAPADPLIAVDLGRTYAAMGDLVSAKAAYLHAAELAPEEPFYWSVLAGFSIENEIEVESLGLPAARRVVALDPGQAVAVDQLGYSHYLSGNWELAERMFAEAIAMEPGLASAHYHLGLLQVVRGDLLAGRRSLENASALDPQGWFGTLARRSLAALLP